MFKKRLTALVMALSLLLCMIPVQATTNQYNLLLDSQVPVYTDGDSKADLIYAPTETGLYWLAKSDWESAATYSISPSAPKYNHDAWVADIPHSGPVYELTAGTTYTITVTTDAPMCNINPWLFQGVAPDAIELAPEQKLSGCVGQRLNVNFVLTPHGSYGSVEFTSSDDSVATFAGGNNATPFCDLMLMSPGIATITATSATSGISTSFDVEVKAPLGALAMAVPTHASIAAGDSVVYTFTPTQSGDYTCYFESNGNIWFNATTFGDDFVSNSGDVNGNYIAHMYDLKAGTTYYLRFENSWHDTKEIDIHLTPAVKASKLSLSPAQSYTKINGNWIDVSIIPEPFYAIDAEETVWAIGDSSVLEFVYDTNTGRFTSLRPNSEGTTTLTATLGDLTASCELQVLGADVLLGDDCMTLDLAGSVEKDLTFIAPKDGNYAVYIHSEEGVFLRPLEPMTDNFYVEEYNHDVLLYTDLKAGESATFRLASDGTYTGMLDVWSTRSVGDNYFTLKSSASQVVQGSTVSMWMSTHPSGFTPIIGWDISDPSVLELTSQDTFRAEFKAIGPGTATVTARTANTTGYDSATYTVDVIGINGQLEVNSGTTQTVNLSPWQTQVYTFEAKADTMYYCYTDSSNVEIRPEVMEPGVSGTGFSVNYSDGPEDWYGTMFTPSQDTTIYVYLRSNMSDYSRISVGAMAARTPVEMSLNQRMVTVFPGSTIALRPIFDMFAYEDVTYTVDNPIVNIETYPHGAEVTATGSGSATITATSESGLTATCNVIAIQPHELVPETPYTANVIGGQHQYFSFTAEDSGRYVVSCDYQEGLSLYPVTLPTDNFRSGDKLLVIYEYLDAGTSAVICLSSAEDFADANVVITAEKGVDASSFTLSGPDTLPVGQVAQLEAVYENPSEYIPINTWEPSDRSILNTGMQSSYVVEIVPQSAGVATITATNRNGVTATKTITVTDIPGTPLPLDQWTTVSGNGPIKVEFTPKTDGYYWIKFPYHDLPSMQTSSDLLYYWHIDSNYEYAGPILPLTGGQTYSIKLGYGSNIDHQVLFTAATEPTSIEPMYSEYTFFTGVNTQIDFQLSPGDSWSNTIFTSSDDTILHIGETASNHCYVRPLKAGTVTVTATTHNGHSTTVKVTVKDPVQLELNQTFTGTVAADSDLPLSFTAPDDGKYCFIFDESISVSKEMNNIESSNYFDDYAYYWVNLTKDESYSFKFHNYNNVALPASVQIIQAPPATGIYLSPGFDVFYLGQNPYLNLTMEPVTASDIRSVTVSDEDVAIISHISASSITLEPKKIGTVTVTVTTFSGLSASCEVTIRENTVISVGEPQVVTVQPYSESYQYAFQAEEGQVYMAYRSEALDYLELQYEDGDYVYNSVNTYVTENGFCYGHQFVAQKSGLIRLVACAYESDGPVTGTIGVTTPVDATGLTLSQTDVQIYTGESVLIDAVFQPVFANSEMVEFSLTGDAVTAEAFSSPRSRRVTGVKAGTATLTVTSATGKTASCTITVVEPSESLQVGFPKELSLAAGESAYFAFTAPDNGWYTINSTGLFSYTTYEYGFASGYSDNWQIELSYDEPRTVLIKISAPEYPASGTITVNERHYSSDVSIPTVNGQAGTTGQVVIETEPGAYFFSQSNWSVADPTIAQIEHAYFNGAVLNFLKAGTTTLTLKAGGKTYTTTVTVTGEVIPGGKAEVSDTDLDDALENKQDDSITLDVTTQEDEEAIATVTLPAGALDKISQQAVTQTTIKMDSATVTLDAKAVANIATQTAGSNVSLSVYTAEENTLTEEQAAVLEDKEVALLLSAKLIADGEPVKKLGGSVSVTIPYELPPEAAPSSISVWYLSDSGLMEKMPTTYADGKLTFTTTHFSDYVVLKDAPAETAFTDVVPGKFYVNAVNWAVANGITTGKTATTFAPTEACTRAQVVTFLWRAAGKPEPQSMDNPFPDVADGKYFTKAVLWAAEQGITGGFSDGTFGPNKTCTRDQIVTFLWRYMGKPAPQSTEITFPDVAAGKFYTDAVLWAAEQGITGGFNDGTFGPAKTCTRDQIVTFLYRAIAHI